MRAMGQRRGVGPIGRLAWPTRPGAFRLFLALTVFAHHCSRFGFGKGPVYLFFALSGFWVQRMWVGRYATTRAPYLTFLISRAWRLLPVFVLAGALTVVTLRVMGRPWSASDGDAPWRVAASSLAILGYADLRAPPVVPAWSLDIEARYYLIAPLLAVASRRVGARAMMMASLATSIVSVAAVTVSGGRPGLAECLPFFVAGLAAAHLDWRPSGRLAAASGGGAVAMLVLVALSPWRGALLGGAHPGPSFAWNPMLNVAVAILALPFALHTTRQASDPADRAMADLSYVVYLLHWIGAVWLGTIGGSAMHRLSHAPVAWAAVLATSWAVWRFVDRPINVARARWVARRSLSAPAAVAREVAGP